MLDQLYKEIGSIKACVEIDLINNSYKHVRLHLVHVPNFNEKGFYHQTRKMGTFTHGFDEKRGSAGNIRSHFNCSKTRLFVCKGWYELIDESLWRETTEFYYVNSDDRYLPTKFYADVENFFVAIGYNRKEKRLFP